MINRSVKVNPLLESKGKIDFQEFRSRLVHSQCDYKMVNSFANNQIGHKIGHEKLKHTYDGAIN